MWAFWQHAQGGTTPPPNPINEHLAVSTSESHRLTTCMGQARSSWITPCFLCGPGCRDAWKGGGTPPPPPPLQGAQPTPSHCLPDGNCQLQRHWYPTVTAPNRFGNLHDKSEFLFSFFFFFKRG